MNEGGQSSTGQVRALVCDGITLIIQLIDFVVSTHPAYPKLLELSKKTGKNTFEILGEKLDEMLEKRQAETLSESDNLIGLALMTSSPHQGLTFLPRSGEFARSKRFAEELTISMVHQFPLIARVYS